MIQSTAVFDHVRKLKVEDSQIRQAVMMGLDNVKDLTNFYNALREAYETTDHGDYKPIKPVNAADGNLTIDKFIKKTLGGYREGILICWDTEKGTYTYNIYEDELCLKQ